MSSINDCKWCCQLSCGIEFAAHLASCLPMIMVCCLVILDSIGFPGHMVIHGAFFVLAAEVAGGPTSNLSLSQQRNRLAVIQKDRIK